MKYASLFLFIFSSFNLLAEEVKSKPIREIAVIAGINGFYPEKIVAFKNEKLKVFFTSTQDQASCMILDQHKLFLSAKKGSISEAEIEVNNSGTFDIYCPGQEFKTKLMVLERPTDKKEEVREVERKPAHWMPRDY
jgi:hypothetical protein